MEHSKKGSVGEGFIFRFIKNDDDRFFACILEDLCLHFVGAVATETLEKLRKHVVAKSVERFQFIFARKRFRLGFCGLRLVKKSTFTEHEAGLFYALPFGEGNFPRLVRVNDNSL